MKNRKEKIAAVVVTYNRKQLLKECLDALLSQTYPLDSIIVIDNASTDMTLEFLSEQGYLDNPKIDCVRLSENIGSSGGFYEGMKRGYEKGYDWLWLMDDDTIADSKALFNLLEKVDHFKDKKIGFVCSKVLWTDGSPHIMNIPNIKSIKDIPNPYKDKNVLLAKTASFVSLLVSKEAIKRVGLPLKEFFIWVDDVEYTLRITRNGFLGFYVKDSIVVHKTKTNYSAFGVYDWRFYYNVRNWLWFYRIHYKKRYFFYLLRQIMLTLKLPFKVWRINIKACIDSLTKFPITKKCRRDKG